MKEKKEKINVGLIFGGKSVEHDISILSAQQALFAICKDKYNVVPIYLTKNNEFLVSESFKELSSFQNDLFKNVLRVYFYHDNNKVFYAQIGKKKNLGFIDVFLVIVHGAGIEDGTLTGFLDLLNVPYTCCNLTSSSVCQDKHLTKIILNHHHIPTLNYIYINKINYTFNEIKKLLEEIPLPVVIKPSTLGSSIGISYVKTLEELSYAITKAFRFSPFLIMEKALTSYREFNQAIYKETSKVNVSLIEEVNATSEILTFVDKYMYDLTKTNALTNRQIPAVIPDTLSERITHLTKNLYDIFNLQGVVRIDYLYDKETDILYVNEINTIPGSLSFYLFDRSGISYTMLIDDLIKNAFFLNQQKKKYTTIFKSSVIKRNGLNRTK